VSPPHDQDGNPGKEKEVSYAFTPLLCVSLFVDARPFESTSALFVADEVKGYPFPTLSITD